jgi:CrcB protein
VSGLWLALAVAVAGGLGAVCRFLLDSAITARRRIDYPVGTMVVNLSGSLLLGILTGVALGHALAPEWAAIVGAGFFGGYTTFSTASLDTVQLAREGRWRSAMLNGFGMLVGALLAAALGLWLGSLL